MRVVVCDPGVGNVRSVVRALARATETAADSPSLFASASASASAESALPIARVPVRSWEIDVSRDPRVVANADFVVLPGQGAFGSFARGIEGGLSDALREHIARARPFLGICIGMQVLFESSDEAPGVPGLGVFRGHVKRLAPGVDPETSLPCALPHMGWNTVERAGEPPRHFYFAHSYIAEPADPSVTVGTTTYGREQFTTIVAHGAVHGVQFHPEKSQREGARLLARFFHM